MSRSRYDEDARPTRNRLVGQIATRSLTGSTMIGEHFVSSKEGVEMASGPVPVPSSSELHAEVVDWLNTEAELLDEGRERDWLEGMVDESIVYQLPLRQTVERARGDGFVPNAFHLDETYGSLRTRVMRNETAYAWAEDPPSRIRHFVTNIRVGQINDERLAVRSNLLIFRTRQDQTNPQLLAGERHDELRRSGDKLRLCRRTIRLDHTVIGTHNLSIFF
jgi:ethylbenzene dioxygenase beta subunit